MVAPALRDPVQDGIVADGLLEVALCGRTFEIGQVAALEKADQVGGRIDEAAVDQLQLSLPYLIPRNW